jgi:NDP-sugar pyrophosphorylase family protein
VEAVVMAAGQGTRLRPLTERYAKPVLPIDGRPVLATLLRELAEAGCSRATIVVGHLAEQVERLAGDGSGFGLPVRYARQPEAHGSADAIRRALAAGATPPFLVAAADTVFTRRDVARFCEAVAGHDGGLAVRRRPPPSPPHRFAVRIERGLVERVLDPDPANPLAGAPLWMLGPAIVPYLEGLGGPPYEAAHAFQRAIDEGRRVAGVEIGPTRDLTHPNDLVEQNFAYVSGLRGLDASA